MLPSKYRLTKQDFDILKSFKKKVFSSDDFTLKIYFSDFSPSRFGIILSSKIFKKAVERNKKKRQIRYIIFKNLKFFQDGLAIVVYLKEGVKEKKIRFLEESLNNFFKESGILKQC